MFMDVTAPLRAGDDTTITLTFSDASTVDITAPVKEFAGANENYDGEMDMGK
jgi:copper(I)-binding protein